MSSRFFLAVLFLVAGLGVSGCSLFRRKPKADKPAASLNDPKDSKTPAADLESDFKTRWIARRAAELVAGGVPADQAQVTASNEYSEAYKFARPAR